MNSIPYPSRLPLAQLPTPIEKISCSLLPRSGALWVKRDDLTGTLTSGNKIRKLEFLLSEARGEGCDSVLTCGGIQSNHARTCAAAAASLGMNCHLFLRGGADAPLEGNLFLDRVLGADLHFLSAEDYSRRRDQLMQEFADRLIREEHRPYIIPEGGSNSLGSFGYILAAEEIYHQVRQAALPVKGLVCAVGSGGTYTGLWLGTRLLHWDIPVWGINICDSAAYFQERILGEMERAVRRFRLPVTIRPEEIRIVDGYVFSGYSQAPAEIHLCIRRLAAETGLILEPVYTAKAFYGMVQEWEKGLFGPDPELLFLHTGGLFGLMTSHYSPFYA